MKARIQNCDQCKKAIEKEQEKKCLECQFDMFQVIADDIENEIRDAVEKELISACEKFPMFSSLHEAYAVVKEEYEESAEELDYIKNCLDLAWNQVKLNNSALALSQFTRMKYAAERLAVEACQVSAMCEKAIQSERKKNHE